MKSLDELVRAAKASDVNTYSPLALAWLGDAVLELLVRSMLLKSGNTGVNTLSKKARNFSSAAAQSRFYEALLPILTEDELAVLKRGRNAKSASRAKNTRIIDYRRATGVEALVGYLALQGRTERIHEIFSHFSE